MTNQQTYIVSWWELYNDDWDPEYIEVQASSEEEAIQKAKDKAPRTAKNFKAKPKTIKENRKMKKSEAIKMIKETILSSLSEKKKSKKDEEEVDIEPSGEEAPTDLPLPGEGGNLEGGAKEVQDALTSLQNAAKSLSDEKLNGQISNLITYFTRTHVSKGQ